MDRITDSEIRYIEALNTRMELDVERGDLRDMQVANRDFHLTIYRASGWEQLCALIRQLWRRFQPREPFA